MSRNKHGFPWLSLTMRLYHPSLPIGLLDNILCPYWAILDKVLLVNQHLQVRVMRSIGERRLWVCPWFSSSIPHDLFMLMGWSFWWEVSGRVVVTYFSRSVPHFCEPNLDVFLR